MRERAAIETLRRCAQALCGELSNAERLRLNALHEEAVRVLEQRRSASTLLKIERLRHLERVMAHMPRGARAAAIRERMRLSKSGYYWLRQLALSPVNALDSHAV